MSDFKNKTITNKGLELLAKAMSGGRLEFTKMQLGSGTHVGDLATQEQLIEVKQNLNLTNITRVGSQVEISSTLLPKDILTDYNWSEIGVFAKGDDGTEILYMYGYTSNSSFISSASLNEKIINVSVLVSNASNVTATINNSLVYLAKDDLNKHNTAPDAHDDIRQLINNINITWDNLQNKPATFPADAHTHTKANIVDFAHTHTKAEVSDFPVSLPANGGTADKVSNALTISLNGVSQGAYNGSTVKNINITAASVGALPNVGAGEVHELGQYLDLHRKGSTADYDARIYVGTDNHIVHLDASGSLAIGREINNLKNTVVNGKTSVANAINGKLGTTLSNQTSFTDMAYYINSIPVFKQENLVSTSSNFVNMKNCRAIAFARQGGSSCILYFANGVTSIGATVYCCAWADGSFSSYRTTFNLTSSKEISGITVGFVVFDSPVSFDVKTRSSEGVIKIF